MDEKDADDDEEPEGGEGDVPPETVLTNFPRRAPPTPAELERFLARFKEVYTANTGLVWYKLRKYRIDRESMRDLHQTVFMVLFSLVKRFGVPASLAKAVSAIAWGTIKNYLRKVGRAVRVAQVLMDAALDEAADATAPFELFLDEVAGLLSEEDAQLIRWAGEERSYRQIGEWLGVPEGTVCTRLRAARKRFVALLDPKSEKEPKTA